MNTLVKLLTHDDGSPQDEPNVWHLYQNFFDGPRTVCTGEVFGIGESGCEYETKEIKKGGITCHRCKEITRWYKSIKL